MIGTPILVLNETVPGFLTTSVSEFGQVDVLINNAGITQPLKLMDIRDMVHNHPV
jgi:short-subunit dehydrogenase involved in D-alanine esterification of teichoic acids